ncbi:MAG: TetR/AcrR family transcriptional regulator [Bacteroidota bacterium]
MEVKSRILEASEELFLKYGVKSITMDEIARHLAISKKTIYQFYQDKDEIVSLVIKQHLERNQESMCQAFASSDDAVDESLQAYERMKSIMANSNPSLLFDLKKYHPEAWKIYLHHKRHFILERITTNLERGINEGLFRSDIQVAVLSRLRLEQIQLGFDAQVFPVEQFNFMEVQTELLDHFLRGIVTDEGLKLLNQYKNK